jgi:hypothetical protein
MRYHGQGVSRALLRTDVGGVLLLSGEEETGWQYSLLTGRGGK